MKFTKKSRFKKLTRFILCLGFCVMLVTESLCGVACAATGIPVTDLEGGPYSKIKVTDITYLDTFLGAVDVKNISGAKTLRLNNNCEITASGSRDDRDICGVYLIGNSPSNSVTITGSATISASNDSSDCYGLRVRDLTVETQGKITVKNISGNVARGVRVYGDESFAVLNVSDLEIDTVYGTKTDSLGLNVMNGFTTVSGDLTIKNIIATSGTGLALAIYSEGGTLTAGFDANGNPNRDATVQIEGDILSIAIENTQYTKIALANENSYIKGNFINPADIFEAPIQANFLTLKNEGTWYPTFDATNQSANCVDVVFDSDGMINLNDKDWDGKSDPARDFRTLDVYGNVQFEGDNNFEANGGIFVINTDLGNPDVAKRGDVINLHHKNVSGTAKVKVAYDPFFDTANDKETLGKEHTFLTLDGVNAGITIKAKETRWDKGNGKTLVFTPTVDSDDNKTWKITSLSAGEDKPKEIVSETTKAVSDTASAINMAWLASTNNLQKRLGDLRNGEESNIGWARFQRSLDDLNNGRKLNVSGNLYQIGYDFALKNDKLSRGYFGLSLERFDGTQSFNIGGGDIKSTTLGAYYTKIYDSGHYFDFIFRYGRYESDTTSLDASVDNPVTTKLDYALNGVTLSGEYGYRASLGKSGLYLEPQAEFIYGYLGSTSKRSSTGVLADIDSTNHFVTRLGLALGQKVKNFNYYLRGSYYHDFADSTNITYGDASYKQDSAQNWWEVSLGGGWNLSDTSYFYAELTKHFKDVSNSLNFNLGFRFTL